MKSNFINDFRSSAEVKSPIIEHKGKINQRVILDILNDLETQMDGFGEKLKITRKAFNVVTECLQNVARYSDEPISEDTEPTFVLDRQEDKYLIISGNILSNDKVSPVREKIDYLNNLDWYGIQQEYKTKIKKNLKEKDETQDKNSAGLGFIEMARKSEEKFVYKFEEINDDFQYFMILITIKKKKA